MNPNPFDELVAHAHDTHVVVVGGGIGGLVAALECAKIGMRVTVVEASDRLGGLVRSAEVAGLTRRRRRRELRHARRARPRASSRSSDSATTSSRRSPAARGSPGCRAAAPLPKGGLLGIPENPFADDVRRDHRLERRVARVRSTGCGPSLTIGKERSLGRLVRIAHGRPGARPPRRAGDLGRVLGRPRRHRRRARGTRAQRRAHARRLALRRRRAARARSRGRGARERGRGHRRRDVAARRRARGAARRARRRDPPRDARSRRSSPRRRRRADAGAAGWTVRTADGELRADQVDRRDVRVGRARAARGAHRRRRTPIAPLRACTSSRSWSTLPTSTPRRAAPGCSRCPAATRAKALTHATAKWPWLRRGRAARSIRTVTSSASRSAPSPSRPPPRASTSPPRPRSRSPRRPRCSASPLDAGAGGRQRHRALRADAAGRRDRAAGCRGRRPRRGSPPRSGIVAVGAWLSGTGLAQVVPDARAQAEIAPPRGAVRVGARARTERSRGAGIAASASALSRVDAGIGIRVYPGTRPPAQRA